MRIKVDGKNCIRFYTSKVCPSGEYTLSCKHNSIVYNYNGTVKSELKTLVLVKVDPIKVAHSKFVEMKLTVRNLLILIYSILLCVCGNLLKMEEYMVFTTLDS